MKMVPHNEMPEIRTHELLNAFGWSEQQRNIQQDVNEFSDWLNDKLEESMKGTDVASTFNDLFYGIQENVISCVNVDYESVRDEKFIDIKLQVIGQKTIEDSFRTLIEPELLDGSNQYDAE